MVRAWRESVIIPTYEIGKSEKNPMFLEKRVYQGSSGVVYPYPVIESIENEPTPKEWHAIWLENEYIKVMVLPELGGRIQMAYDKLKERHFVYYNHVIKPALVGLTGPWISGGIEFNWPQHHRPSTFLPVDSTIVENEDGSVTVWVNEMERMFHQKGAAGFTLRPGCAYLEIQGRVSNRTPLPQTFLWWANPAVEVNDAYQSVFPPDVNAVFDHGKRAVSSFPIATGTYYKMDYSAGVDISNYRNIPVPTSYMAVNSKYDFEGGYENDTHCGMLHVASHHFSPGKKQWTWGNGDFGRAWDRNLTDEEKGRFRPYIELMAGVYTENQPDFTWLMPYEEKQFTQYFMPYSEVGMVKQATKDFIFGLTPGPSPIGEGSGHTVCFKVLATSRQTVQMTLYNKQGETYFNQVVTLSPEEVFEQTVDVKDAEIYDLRFTINNEASRAGTGLRSGLARSLPLMMWQAEPDDIRPIPDAAEAALSPGDTKTNDQLYLTGLHLEQYRHATWSALDYYEEALRRDPNDVRCLNQTGLWYLRRGRFDKAEPFLRKAVKVWQKRNPNPYDSEPIFNLALCLKYKSLTPSPSPKERGVYSSSSDNSKAEAYELFWKSTWSKAWADAGYFEAARISVSQGRYADALDELDRCLVSNAHNHQARALKAAVLRYVATESQQTREAFIEESLALDRFNYGICYEHYLLRKDAERDGMGHALTELTTLMRSAASNYDELALDYAAAGLFDEAIAIWHLAEEQGAVTPLTYYYIGWLQLAIGDTSAAARSFEQAEQLPPDYCFPNRLEDVLALSAHHGARASYYLGCLYYDKRQYDLAIENWECSSMIDPTFPTVWRNLALARFNKQRLNTEGTEMTEVTEQAVEYMERAFHLDESDARTLMELDQLYKRIQKPHQERLDFMQHYPQLIAQRDDLVLEEITLLNQLGRYEEAMTKLDAHKFHPWEGGEGKVSGQYQICRVELAKRLLGRGPEGVAENGHEMHDGDAEEAIRLLQECLVFPPHLGEGKLFGAQDNDFYYLLGLAYGMLGKDEEARNCWQKGTVGPTEPAAAMYYNDAKPDKIFYAGLCYRKLGQEDKARSLFNKLVGYGKQHIFDHVTMDYFAVSLPDLLIWDGDLDRQNRIHCLYMLALGYYGLGDKKHAERYLADVEEMDINHYGVQALKSITDLRFTIY